MSGTGEAVNVILTFRDQDGREWLAGAVMAPLTAARSALGATYQGYKGGDYRMDGDVHCWIAHWGCEGSPITATVLDAMLRQPEPAAEKVAIFGRVKAGRGGSWSSTQMSTATSPRWA